MHPHSGMPPSGRPSGGSPLVSGGEPRRSSLRHQLLLAFLLAIALSVVLLGSALVFSFFQETVKNRQARLTESAEAVARLVEAYVQEHRRGIVELAVAVEEIGGQNPAHLERRLHEFHRRTPELLTLLITDAEGRVIADERQLSLGGGPLASKGRSVADREYFRQPRANGRPYVSDAFRGRNFGNDPIVAVSAPWRTPDGAFAGVVEGSLDLVRLGEAGTIFKRLPGQEIFITDGRRQLLWSTRARAEPLTPVILDDAGARPVGQPGRRVLAGRAEVARTGWQVAVQQPVSQIYRSAIPQAWITLAWMAAVFVSASVLAHYLSRRITRPLEELSASLDRIDLGAAPPSPAPPDTGAPREVATIVQATRRLLERLRVSYDALSRLLAQREATIEDEIEQRTRAEQERDQLFILSQDMLCIAGFDGYFKQLNPAWEKALGWSLAELMARPYLDFVHPDDVERTSREAQSLRQGGIISDFEIRFQTRDGHDRWLAWGAASVPEKELIYAVVRDTSERKKLERMKEDFVSIVSHELRTPLTSIRGALGLILGGVAGEIPEKARTLTEIAARNSERLVRLVNDILDMDKLEAGMALRPARVEIVPLVEHAVEINRAYAQQYGVELRIVAADEARVWADTDRLQQVLANLLSNAAKHSPRGADVEIAVRRRDGWVCVSVSDHGQGIPPKFQHRIFEKFAQAETASPRQKEGTGLGLSISKAIMDQLGGRLWFESVPGAGTTFAFELPESTGDERPQSHATH